jgi:DNA primase
LGLESFPRTSGHEGMHVLVPLERVHEPEEARAFVQLVARAIARSHPGLGVSIDAKMNGRGQQFVSAYSARPDTARVCTPLRWDEIAKVDPAELTTDAVLERVARLGDVHAGVLSGAQRLRPAMERFAGRA